MFLATKLNLLSGMIIGASAVLLMKEMCKTRCKHKQKQEHNAALIQLSRSGKQLPRRY